MLAYLANNLVVDAMPILLSYGAWVVDEDNNPTVNTPEFKKAMEAYKSRKHEALEDESDEVKAMVKELAEETGMPVTIAANPLDCVVLGTAKRLEAGSGFDNYVFRRGKRFR